MAEVTDPGPAELPPVGTAGPPVHGVFGTVLQHRPARPHHPLHPLDGLLGRSWTTVGIASVNAHRHVGRLTDRK